MPNITTYCPKGWGEAKPEGSKFELGRDVQELTSWKNSGFDQKEIQKDEAGGITKAVSNKSTNSFIEDHTNEGEMSIC